MYDFLAWRPDIKDTARHIEINVNSRKRPDDLCHPSLRTAGPPARDHETDLSTAP